MLFRDNDEPLLTTWLERRLAKVSDAEAPILAEYCIALLRHDQGEEEVFNLCVDQLKDFLKGDTRSFVSDVFQAIKDRSFAGANAGSRSLTAVKARDTVPLPKRTSPPRPSSERQLTANAVVTKDNGANELPQMPLPPPEMMMDPAFMMYMQQMNTIDRPRSKRKRCFAFDQRGVCHKGSACPYEHVTEQRNFHEYDPNFSGMSNTVGNNAPLPVTTKVSTGNQKFFQSSDGKGTFTLAIENIPTSHLDESSVRHFFEPFGSVISVEIVQTSSRAIVSFADKASATAAFMSPRAVFDNRFVKVLWAQSTDPIAQNASKTKTTPASQPVLGSVDLVSIANKQAEHDERLRKKIEVERRSAALAEQMAALAKEKEQHAQTLRELNGSPERSVTSTMDTRSTLQAQLAELKERAALLGVSPEDFAPIARQGRGAANFVSRGRGRGRARPAPYANSGPKSLDLRPRTILIKGELPSSQLEERIRQQSQYESIDVDVDGSISVTFKTRRDAEMFSATNRSLGEMSWVRNVQSQRSQSNNDSEDKEMEDISNRYDD